MANDAMRTSILDGLIRQAGVPIDGISVTDINAVPPVVVIQFQVSATQEQKDLAAQILASFDWRRRRALDRSIVVTALQSLTAPQRNTLLVYLLSEYLRTNTSVAAQIGVAAGIPVVVDEVDPT